MKTLLPLATEVNSEFSKIKTNYIDLGKKLKLLRDRVKNETNIPWRQWCRNYLRKSDGKEFSYKTIENYIYLSGDSDRVDRQKHMQRENIRKIRKKAQHWTPGMHALFDKTNTTSDQFNILVSAWECATNEAQLEFLEIIGARM